MFKYVTNLLSTQVADFQVPPHNPPTLPSFPNKAAYRQWSVQTTTNHVFASAYTGTVETLRVSESNPPLKLAGLIVDYDTHFQGDTLAQLVANSEDALRPRYLTRTHSGGIRLWYVFEEPILFNELAVGKKFLEIAMRKLDLRSIFPGLDEKSFLNYGQYYEIGHDWEEVPDSGIVPLFHLEAWMGDAVRRSLEGKTKGKLQIPFEQIREALEQKYPGAWPGGWDKFEVGARGARFWDGGDAKSCIVRPDGITCFTGNVGFVPWGELLGREWVERNTDRMMGEAIESLYFEASANKYWRHKTNIGWQQLGKEDLRLHFRMHGIPEERPRGETTSPMDRLIHQVQMTHSVGGTFPFHYRSEEIITNNGQPFLNISRVKLMQPDASRSGRWGDGFPNVAAYYEGFYDREHQPEQFAHAMAEIMWFYQTAYEGDVQRGRVLIHAGPAGAGKTYQTNILSDILGGSEDASRYLFGQDGFNASLVATPLWVVDDPVAVADRRTTAIFSQMLKTIAACDKIPVRGMYREMLRLPWLGRVLVNMNDDPESIRLLPSTEMNLMDKVALFLVQKPFKGRFPSNNTIRAELPAFCTFLLEGREFLENIEPNIFDEPRWGVRKFHHPRLLSVAQSAQTSTSVEEMLNLWRKIWFNMNPESDRWMGNPTELMDAIICVDSIRDIQRGVAPGPQALGRALAQLVLRENPPGWLRSFGDRREYVIYRAEDGALTHADPF